MFQWKLGKMEGTYDMLTLLTLLVLGVIAFKLAHRIAILMVGMIATVIAAWLHLQSHKIACRLLAGRPTGAIIDIDAAWKSDRAQRRLMARHLRHSLRLTELSSLLPASCSRGKSMAQAAPQRSA